ncbi:MAG TPA: hypothetical protein DCM28_12410 [Phycisphaerales bacterium]|nr:hypothetical protein [Phycisphaerales bacterium]HCD33040.1 hypothetical protein [Phycisphaerales bacterium]|tara:strand:+ start:270 stop:1475 length:1206 start_codon:yes stop_codon:yes gene_type:complete
MPPFIDIHPIDLPNQWCVHSYYTLNPYAPDGSNRLLLAAADLEKNVGHVLVLSPDRKVTHRLGPIPITPSFWHTGAWQSWSPDARYIYYQSGTHTQSTITRYDLTTEQSITLDGDMEGLPPSGEPGISCSHAMLYAAGYGDKKYHPELTPVPFQARDQHGISKVDFESQTSKLIYTTQQMLDEHPCREQLLQADRQVKSRLGDDDGLTLMLYCVRWNRQGTRMLFYFGNHCVVPERGEPRIAYIMTADRDLKNIHMAADLSFGKGGVHWGWCPDGEHLLGYGLSPVHDEARCIATVHHTGKDYRKLCTHGSGGHPTISPANPNLLVTDDYAGNVEFIDLAKDQTLLHVKFPTSGRDKRGTGRTSGWIDTHPVFNNDGSKVLVNSLPDRHGQTVEFSIDLES